MGRTGLRTPRHRTGSGRWFVAAMALGVLEDNEPWVRPQLRRYLEANRPRARGPSRRALPSMNPVERSVRVHCSPAALSRFGEAVAVGLERRNRRCDASAPPWSGPALAADTTTTSSKWATSGAATRTPPTLRRGERWVDRLMSFQAPRGPVGQCRQRGQGGGEDRSHGPGRKMDRRQREQQGQQVLDALVDPEEGQGFLVGPLTRSLVTGCSPPGLSRRRPPRPRLVPPARRSPRRVRP